MKKILKLFLITGGDLEESSKQFTPIPKPRPILWQAKTNFRRIAFSSDPRSCLGQVPLVRIGSTTYIQEVEAAERTRSPVGYHDSVDIYECDKKVFDLFHLLLLQHYIAVYKNLQMQFFKIYFFIHQYICVKKKISTFFSAIIRLFV